MAPYSRQTGSRAIDDELEAALSFLVGLDDALAGELVALDWATGVFDHARPRVWDANYVRLMSSQGFEAWEIAAAI